MANPTSRTQKFCSDSVSLSATSDRDSNSDLNMSNTNNNNNSITNTNNNNNSIADNESNTDSSEHKQSGGDSQMSNDNTTAGDEEHKAPTAYQIACTMNKMKLAVDTMRDKFDLLKIINNMKKRH